jgi:hypothetical protein
MAVPIGFDERAERRWYDLRWPAASAAEHPHEEFGRAQSGPELDAHEKRTGPGIPRRVNGSSRYLAMLRHTQQPPTPTTAQLEDAFQNSHRLDLVRMLMKRAG